MVARCSWTDFSLVRPCVHGEGCHRHAQRRGGGRLGRYGRAAAPWRSWPRDCAPRAADAGPSRLHRPRSSSGCRSAGTGTRGIVSPCWDGSWLYRSAVILITSGTPTCTLTSLDVTRTRVLEQRADAGLSVLLFLRAQYRERHAGHRSITLRGASRGTFGRESNSRATIREAGGSTSQLNPPIPQDCPASRNAATRRPRDTDIRSSIPSAATTTDATVGGP